MLSACAPDGSGVEDGNVPPTSETAVGPEPSSPVAVVAAKQAIVGRQVALLGAVVDIPFEYTQVYDRVGVGPNEVPERQVGLVASGTDHKELATALQRAMDQAGFRTQAVESKDGGWVWITLYGDAGQAKVAVRPDGKKPGTVIVFKIPEA